MFIFNFCGKKNKIKNFYEKFLILIKNFFFLIELIWVLYCYKIYLLNVYCVYNYICILFKFNLL